MILFFLLLPLFGLTQTKVYSVVVYYNITSCVSCNFGVPKELQFQMEKLTAPQSFTFITQSMRKIELNELADDLMLPKEAVLISDTEYLLSKVSNYVKYVSLGPWRSFMVVYYTDKEKEVIMIDSIPRN